MNNDENRYRIAARVGALRPTAVNRVLREVRTLQSQGGDLVSLMRGQPDTPTPAHIVDAAHAALRSGRTGYPDNTGEPGLRAAVAEALERDHGLRYDPASEILITDGATLGVSTAFAALLDQDDELLLPDPVYDAYGSPIALWGGRAVAVPASIRDGRFTIDRAELDARITPATRAVLLNTPWNPVGTVFTRSELEDLVACVVEHNLILISDEIYASLVYDGRTHVSPAAVSEAACVRTLVINSLSKTYAMTGWRVGYCAGPPDLIAAMSLVLQQSSRGPATFVQDAAECALRSDQSSVRAMRAEYQARRDFVVDRLLEIPGVTPWAPEGGLFVMVDVRGLGRTSDDVRRWLLEEAGVVVVHGSAYGPSGEGTLRVSFAAGGRVLEQGVDRLRAGLLALARSNPGKGPG
jgi:aspartate/methionine/tyrosine aminotransferase